MAKRMTKQSKQMLDLTKESFFKLYETKREQAFHYFVYSVINILKKELNKKPSEAEILTEVFTVLEEENKQLIEKYMNGGLANYYIQNIKSKILFAEWKPTKRALEIISGCHTIESEFPNGVYSSKQRIK